MVGVFGLGDAAEDTEIYCWGTLKTLCSAGKGCVLIAFSECGATTGFVTEGQSDRLGQDRQFIRGAYKEHVTTNSSVRWEKVVMSTDIKSIVSMCAAGGASTNPAGCVDGGAGRRWTCARSHAYERQSQTRVYCDRSSRAHSRRLVSASSPPASRPVEASCCTALYAV